MYLESIEVKDVTDEVGKGLEYRFVHLINTDSPEEGSPLGLGNVDGMLLVISILYDGRVKRVHTNNYFLLVVVVLNSYRLLALPRRCESVGYQLTQSTGGTYIHTQ